MNLLGALVIAMGALLGIWLGAYYAAGRLGTQLDEQARWFAERREEDRRRLAEQLQAESGRLDRQLAHDRRMRDRDELRGSLDAAIEAMGLAVNSAFEVLAEAGIYHLINQAIHQYVVAGREFADAGAASVAAVYGMGEQSRRLRFRLSGHELTQHYATVRDEVIELLASPSLERERRTGEEHNELQEKFQELKRGAERFIEMASDFMAGDNDAPGEFGGTEAAEESSNPG
jgi:hypothetical protein